MAEDTLMEHVADIVSAHVSNNSVSAADLPTLIKTVYASLAGLGKPAEPVEEPREPAVSIRSSVKPNRLTCLDCGAKFKMLKRHLRPDHNLTPAEYRARWNLTDSYPMVAADYAAMRADLAKKIGLGRKPGMTKAKAVANPSATAKAQDKAKTKLAAQTPAKSKAPATAMPAAKPRKKLGVAFDEPTAAAPTSPKATPAPAHVVQPDAPAPEVVAPATE